MFKGSRQYSLISENYLHKISKLEHLATQFLTNKYDKKLFQGDVEK